MNIFPADNQCLQYGHLMVQNDVYRGEDYMKKVYEFLREHAMKIISFEKKKMIPLTKEQQGSYEKMEICYI